MSGFARPCRICGARSAPGKDRCERHAAGSGRASSCRRCGARTSGAGYCAPCAAIVEAERLAAQPYREEYSPGRVPAQPPAALRARRRALRGLRPGARPGSLRMPPRRRAGRRRRTRSSPTCASRTGDHVTKALRRRSAAGDLPGGVIVATPAVLIERKKAMLGVRARGRAAGPGGLQRKPGDLRRAGQAVPRRDPERAIGVPRTGAWGPAVQTVLFARSSQAIGTRYEHAVRRSRERSAGGGQALRPARHGELKRAPGRRADRLVLRVARGDRLGHFGCDDDSIEQYLPLDVVPWGAPNANTDGIHIEQMGLAAWSTQQWYQQGRRHAHEHRLAAGLPLPPPRRRRAAARALRRRAARRRSRRHHAPPDHPCAGRWHAHRPGAELPARLRHPAGARLRRHLGRRDTLIYRTRQAAEGHRRAHAAARALPARRERTCRRHRRASTTPPRSPPGA